MAKIQLEFADGSSDEFDAGTTPAQVLEKKGLARNALAAKLDESIVLLTAPLTTSGKLSFLTFGDVEGRHVYWHSAAHVLAHAISRLYPDAKNTIGPPTEDGFYYDFDDLDITEDDFEKIEKEMEKIIKENHPFIKSEITLDDVHRHYHNNHYKSEIAKQAVDKGDKLTEFSDGDFRDLCRGPHLSSTGRIKVIKLLKLSRAYWRGDAKNKQLTRIYGTAYPERKMLKEHLRRIEDAKKFNHIVLGKKLDLFVTSDVVGKGLPLLKPKGAAIYRELFRFIQDEELKRGYQFTQTPVMAKNDLYKLSGHYDLYKESMFCLDCHGQEVMLRPMTCPHQFMIYKSETHSYKDLPVRLAEISTLFRKEQSGELHGLIRLWQFTLADAHIFCSPGQVEEEFAGVLDLIKFVMDMLGFDDYWYRFSKWDPKKRGEKYVDNPKAWEETQATMKAILDKLGLEYEEADDEAAFYGPKLDVQMRNIFGKEDTVFTVQIDFALPERFDLTYVDEHSQEQRPYVIHRSSIGCLERTMAMLIEKYRGKFPLWLSPVQVKVLTIADRFAPFAKDAVERMVRKGIRAQLDDRTESLGKKVRQAQLEYVPYILVIGEKEVEAKSVNVRTRDNIVHGTKPLAEFIKQVKEEVEERK